MRIDGEFEYKGKHYPLEYEDCDDFSILPKDRCAQIRSICFYGGKMLIGLHGDGWAPIGGTIEKDELPEETLIREVREEANMRVTEQAPIGYQKVTDDEGKEIYQLRGWCRVETIGDFVADPDHGVKEIKLIDPKDYKQYFDWGAIGDRIMERAMEIEIKTAHH
jgi:8-oxo-dGTP pyrophosphatase MutT (NUDIX family)